LRQAIFTDNTHSRTLIARCSMRPILGACLTDTTSPCRPFRKMVSCSLQHPRFFPQSCQHTYSTNRTMCARLASSNIAPYVRLEDALMCWEMCDQTHRPSGLSCDRTWVASPPVELFTPYPCSYDATRGGWLVRTSFHAHHADVHRLCVATAPHFHESVRKCLCGDSARKTQTCRIVR